MGVAGWASHINHYENEQLVYDKPVFVSRSRITDAVMTGTSAGNSSPKT